jgi:hypothetical protein
MSQALGWAAVKSSDLKLFRTLKDFLYVLMITARYISVREVLTPNTDGERS